VPFLVQRVLVIVPLEGVLYHICISIDIWFVLWRVGPALPSTGTCALQKR
jgi:hypothetical protein